MTTYRIRNLMTALDDSVTPPAFLPVIFPNFDGSQAVSWGNGPAGRECFVTFDEPQTPVDLGPLIKVELIESP